MRIAGVVLALISGGIIVFNFLIRADNKKIADESPFVTLFTGGSNLTPYYDFWPPDSLFEIMVIGFLIIGLALAFWEPKE